MAPQRVKWVPIEGKLDLGKLGARPVEGGREANGEGLYPAQAYYDNAWRPGKHSEGLPGEFVHTVIDCKPV